MQDEKLNNRNEKVEDTNTANTQNPNINLGATQEPVQESTQGICPYWMTQNCPMTATLGTQYNQNGMYQPNDFMNMGQPMQNWWGQGGQNPYDYGNGVAQFTSPNYVSDVWSQNQSNCTKNCVQDMYVNTGMPQPTYMPGYMNDMNMQNQAMFQSPCIKRNNNGCSYGACCSPYGLGRY